ncbi:MAG TPA: hypothetical protein DF613_04190 [Lachnospiraceae bacterium]|nr:hypothetical protein [Lachnospiraceae bacterium]
MKRKHTAPSPRRRKKSNRAIWLLVAFLAVFMMVLVSAAVVKIARQHRQSGNEQESGKQTVSQTEMSPSVSQAETDQTESRRGADPSVSQETVEPSEVSQPESDPDTGGDSEQGKNLYKPAEETEKSENSFEESDTDNSAGRSAENILAGMTLEEKVYQLFIVTQEQLTGVSKVTQSGETTRESLKNKPVGGIVYFAPNLVSRGQCAEMIGNVQSYSELGLFIAVDEEGGTVARLGNNRDMGTTSFPAMGKIGDSGDAAQAYNVGYTIGTEIAELGFNLDFAPVADVNSNPANTVIGTRAFSSDPEVAAGMVAACVEGFRDSGILCSLKHFPGHGDTYADSHYGEAETLKSLEQLRECELLPFTAGIDAGAPFIMVGHITAPNIIKEPVPASLSHELITGLLREELGYTGLVITDSMMMQAITDQYSSGEAAVKAIQAGVDIILMPEDLESAVSGVLNALSAGDITEGRIDESVLRVLEAKISSGIIAG